MTTVAKEVQLTLSTLQALEHGLRFRIGLMSASIKELMKEKGNEFKINEINDAKNAELVKLRGVEARIEALETAVLDNSELKVISKSSKTIGGLPITVMVIMRGTDGGKKTSITRHLKLAASGKYVGVSPLKTKEIVYQLQQSEIRKAA